MPPTDTTAGHPNAAQLTAITDRLDRATERSDRVFEPLEHAVAVLSEVLHRLADVLGRDDLLGRLTADDESFEFHFNRLITLEALEAAYIEHVMRECHGNRSQTAAILGIDPSTLYRKLARQGD